MVVIISLTFAMFFKNQIGIRVCRTPKNNRPEFNRVKPRKKAKRKRISLLDRNQP
jgi:hypothetical protein